MRHDRNKMNVATAVSVLGLTAEDAKDERSMRRAIVRKFRKQVLRRHPDKGGERHEFERTVAARDAALANVELAVRLLTNQKPLNLRTAGAAWAQAIGGLD